MSFGDLKAKAQAELDALAAEVATDVGKAKSAVEAAYELGATHHFLQILEADASSVYDKLKKAFDLGKSSV